MNKCKDCGKKTKGFGIRCQSCANTGKKHSNKTKKQMSETRIRLGLAKGKNNNHYKDGCSLKDYYCLDCGIKLSGYPAIKCLSCSKKELFKDPTNHPRFINGKSREPYTIEFSNELKEQIRDRDNHECKICHKKEENLFRKLDVHHIDYNKENCEKINLISLCCSCHRKTNSSRDYYYAYFKYLIEETKQCLRI